MEIVALNAEHERPLEAFRQEFAEAGEDHIPGFLPNPEWAFRETVAGFAAWACGESLPPGWVPGTTLFLVDGGRILGVINLRHWLAGTLRQFGGHVGYSVRPSERGKGYATRMLEHVKTRAATLGIDRLLITCEPENVASACVAEKCGGVFEDEIFFEPIERSVRRYWIDLA